MGNNPIPPPKGKGRPPGSVNKATANARAAIADFVEGNVDRLSGWLDAIANGEKVKKKIIRGDVEIEVDGWLREPDPDAALKAYMSVIEYHIPKLARMEQTLSAPDGGPVKHDMTVRFVE